jgi:hypothetical protein
LIVQGLELLADQALVLPNGLQQAFGRRVVVIVENRDRAAPHAPKSIKAGHDRRHRAIAFALLDSQCQASED